jgi:hypothetical protein
MMIATPTLPLAYLDVDPSVRWFCRHGCVVHRDDLVEMFVGGSLIGSFAPRDTGVRNALVVGLAEDPAVHLGRLAKAFGLTSEGLRPGRRQHESHGLAAVVARKRGGGVTKLTAAVRRKLERRFEKGESVQSILAHERRVGRATIYRVRAEWLTEQRRREQEGRTVPVEATGQVQLAGVEPDAAPSIDTRAANEAPVEERDVGAGIASPSVLAARTRFIRSGSSAARWQTYALLGLLATLEPKRKTETKRPMSDSDRCRAAGGIVS